MELLNQASFQSKIQGDLPLVVDFFAEWCGPCKMLSPVLEALATEFAGNLEIAKVDVDSEQDLSSELGVTAMPTLIVFKGGQEVDRITGFQSQDVLRQKFESYLA